MTNLSRRRLLGLSATQLLTLGALPALADAPAADRHSPNVDARATISSDSLATATTD